MDFYLKVIWSPGYSGVFDRGTAERYLFDRTGRDCLKEKLERIRGGTCEDNPLAMKCV